MENITYLEEEYKIYEMVSNIPPYMKIVKMTPKLLEVKCLENINTEIIKSWEDIYVKYSTFYVEDDNYNFEELIKELKTNFTYDLKISKALPIYGINMYKKHIQFTYKNPDHQKFYKICEKYCYNKYKWADD